MRRAFLPLVAMALGAWLGFGAGALAATVTLYTGEVLTGEIRLGAVAVIRTSDAGFAKLDPSLIQQATFGEANEDFAPGVVLKSGGRAPALPPGVAPGEVAWWVYGKFTAVEARAIKKGKTGALMNNGDFFEGTVREASAEKARILSPIFGLRTFEAKSGDVLAVVAGEVKPPAANYEVRLLNGAALAADGIGFDGAGLLLRKDGALQTVPLADLAEVRASPSRALPLSYQAPGQVTAALGSPQKPYGIDAMLDGTPLRVGPDTFPSGLAAWTNCGIGWAVPQGMGEIVGRVGVPPTMPPNVRLAFVVYLDGRSAWRSEPMTTGDVPAVFRVPLGNARAVALRVEPQFPSSATGTGIWIAPMLLKR